MGDVLVVVVAVVPFAILLAGAVFLAGRYQR